MTMRSQNLCLKMYISPYSREFHLLKPLLREFSLRARRQVKH
jgi:hypothetical protein